MEKLQWETIKVKVKDLVQLDINPRKISEEKKQKLSESLDKFNLVEIPAVNTDMKIIGGNQRVTALLIAGRGEEEIDVRYPNRKLTAKEIKEYAIISNTHAGEFDFDVLNVEFADIDLHDIGFEIQGLNDWEMKQAKILAEEAHEDNYVIPDEIGTDIVEGELFEIGEHRLLCGDSTLTDTWKLVMRQQLADLVVTDPPYNVDYIGKTKDALTIQNDSMSDGSFYQFLYEFYTALGSFTKAGGAWYVWHADSKGTIFRNAMEDAGILIKQCLIWVKNSIVMGRQDYQWKHEPCLYGWKEGAAHYFTYERNKTTVIEDNINPKKLTKDELLKMVQEMLSDKVKTTILRVDKPLKSDIHPTMKPILLLSQQIDNSSRIGEIVADGFLGSGSTMVAAHQLNRKCYGMELDPKYCQVIIDRMRKLDPSLKITRNGQPYGL